MRQCDSNITRNVMKTHFALKPKLGEGGVKRAPFFLFCTNQKVNKLLPRSLVAEKLVTS